MYQILIKLAYYPEWYIVRLLGGNRKSSLTKAFTKHIMF